jgi:hypothetical protein
MHRELAMEHYRLHVIEQWPDSARKEAGIAAVRSTIESLERSAPAGQPAFECIVCAARNKKRAGSRPSPFSVMPLAA